MTDNLRISVGQLVERCCVEGDLHSRTGSWISGQEGTAAHQRIQRKRKRDWGDAYRSEVSVSAQCRLPGVSPDEEVATLGIRGRIDGLLVPQSPSGTLIVEEIKTISGSPDRVPETLQQLHWSQVILYAALLFHESDRVGNQGRVDTPVRKGTDPLPNLAACSDTVELRLCYFDPYNGEEHVLMRSMTRLQLGLHLTTHLARYADILRIDREWRLLRDPTLRDLPFPMQRYRAGQHALSRLVYTTLRDRRTAYLQAPTGLGKTLGCLFPAVKGLPHLGLNRVFYLTARQSGAGNAERALAQMRTGDVRLRSLSITAKERACLNPGARCDGEHCPYAKGYYERRTDAMSMLLATDGHLGSAEIERAARLHQVCPFELSLDTARHMDVVVCDYNYAFDPMVYLRRFFDETSTERQVLLIDEIHNLVERGRDMFSATLDSVALNQLMSGPPDDYALVSDGFVSCRDQLMPQISLVLAECHEISQRAEAGELDTHVVPDTLLSALKGLCGEIEALLRDAAASMSREGAAVSDNDELLAVYFNALRFLRTSEWFDHGYRTLVTSIDTGHVTVSLVNVNPSGMLASRLSQAESVIGFSATLSPQNYFETMLGGTSADWYRFRSPFDASHQGVFIAPYISTSWRRRESSSDRLVDLIDSVVHTESGNYLVCFPSYRYLEVIHQRYSERKPPERILRQFRDDDLAHQQAFLDAFTSDEPVTGFAVLGGRFSEGVDLIGRRLIGVIVVGVGLPQLGPERDLIREHFDAEGIDGFQMAYQYPGFNRVLQGAGRVIRSEDDMGIVCLVDDRFARNDYSVLMPSEWDAVTCHDAASLSRQVAGFWDRVTTDSDRSHVRGGDHPDDGRDRVDVGAGSDHADVSGCGVAGARSCHGLADVDSHIDGDRRSDGDDDRGEFSSHLCQGDRPVDTRRGGLIDR